MDTGTATLNEAFAANGAACRAGSRSTRGAIRQLAETAAAISPHGRKLSSAERALRAELMDFEVSGTLPMEKRVDIACRLDTIGRAVTFPAALTLVAACSDWLTDPRNLQLTYLLHMAAFRVLNVLNACGGQD